MPSWKRRGQISIFIALMMSTFILFFLFVVNIGMLVNAKINIQNAADMAAFSGASVQARLLNNISFLNYEMRRQLKKYLFRYYVLANMAQESNPDFGGETRRWMNATSDANSDMGAPTVCFMFRDNYCRVTDLAPIPVDQVTPNPLNQMSVILHQQLQALEAIRQDSCKTIALGNGQVLSLWLYNSEPNVDTLGQLLAASGAGGGGASQADAERYAKVLQSVQKYANGLGLVPTELLLASRIRTLNYYVNFKPSSATLTLESVGVLEGEGDWAARERPIQAFYSAYHTLSKGFSDESVTLTELLPAGSDGYNLLHLEPITANFEGYFRTYDIPGAFGAGSGGLPVPTGLPSATPPEPCSSRMDPVFVTNVPMGFFKDKSVLTYYAVKLEAETTLFFNPFGNTVKLRAYASAQPFGSRIGPDSTVAQFVKEGFKPGDNVIGSVCQSRDCKGIPNLPIGAEDSNAGGWTKGEVLAHFFGRYTQAGGVLNEAPDVPILERVYHEAMAPNPWEIGRYNIPDDLGEENASQKDDGLDVSSGADPFINYFDDSLTMAMWAPLVSIDRTDEDPAQEIAQLMRENLPGEDDDPNKAVLIGQMVQYVNNLRQSQGVDGDGFNVARIQDPLRYLDANGQVTTVSGPETIIIADPVKIRSSFSKVRHGALAARGRTGYSVKFIPLKALHQNPEGLTTDGTATWTNVPGLDVDAEQDLEALKH